MVVYDFSGKLIYWDQIVETMVPEISNFVFVFDYCNKNSLDCLRGMIAKIRSNRSVRIGKAVVLGNKSDITKSQVTQNDVTQFSIETGLEVKSVSVKETERVLSIFKDFLK